MKSFLEFIKDVRDCSHRHPFEKGNKYLYWRNLVYMHSQPKYLWGRVIDKVIRMTDKICISSRQKYTQRQI